MNLQSLITDNITELLVMIIDFTHIRQAILIKNIGHAGDMVYVPKDLPVEEFSEQLYKAINEHVRNRRLLLHDSENVKFGSSGSFSVELINDKRANELLKISREEYVRFETDKLIKNCLNQKIAAELLRQKQHALILE